MDYERNNPEDRGRLGREGNDGPGQSGSDGPGSGDDRGFEDRSSRDRPHPPEQYPGKRSSDDRYSESGYSSGGSSDGGGYSDYRQHQDEGRIDSQDDRGSSGKGWGIAAVILAVLSFIAAFLLAFFNLVLAIPALILGIVARRKGSRGLGLAAIIISILAILLGIIITVVLGAVLLNSPEFQQILQEAQ